MDNAPTSKIDTLHYNCETIECDLDEYLDGALQPRANAAFERHLSTCSECAEMVHDIKNVVSSARSLAEQPLAEGVAQRLRAHLSAELGLRFAGERLEHRLGERTGDRPNLILVK